MTGRPVRRHVLALAVPLGVALALHLPVLGAWWTFDDPCLIAPALRSGIAPHFYDPGVWRELSGTVLMPWQTLSLGLDAHLFGLEPAAFYAHHLLAFTVLLGVAYAVFQGSLGRVGTSFALTLFVLGTPAWSMARLLMNRHYLEGMVFALGALGLHRLAVRQRRWGPALAGAGLYLLAMSAKEVFVPAVALFVVVPVGEWRERFLRAAPYALAAALYVPWRLAMLGVDNSFSGYLDPGTPRDPSAVLAALGLPSSWAVLALALAVVAALGVVARRAPGVLALAVVGAVLLGGPLVTVGSMLAPRHFLLPSLAIAVLLTAALKTLKNRRLAAGLGVLLLAGSAAMLEASRLRQRFAATAAHYRAEGTFLLDRERDGLLLTELPDTNFLACLDELRRDVLGVLGGPGYCGEPCWCGRQFPGAAWWRYDRGRVRPFNRLPGPACHVERPLTAQLDHDPRRARLSWELGPWSAAEGTYALLLVRGRGRPGISIPVPVPPSGEIPFTPRDPLAVIVVFQDQDGRRTWTPKIPVKAPGSDSARR